MDVVRTRIWNERTDNKEPSNLVDVRDNKGLANLFRSFSKKDN